MTAEYAFDLYPRSNPKNGARLVRYTFEDLISAEYRDVIGVGAGQAVIQIDHAGAEHIDSAGEQYIRVVRLGGVEKVVGGIWTSKLPFETAVAQETRRLTVSGPGQMAYLARSRMAPHTYIHDVFTGQDPIGGTWSLSNQSTVFANGPYLGAMLWRVIYEAQHFRSGPYTHRHSDGIEYTDTHADDRTVSRIPDLVMGFDQFTDSNGNDWTLTAGEFSVQVGDNVLGIVQRLMQAGLFVWMDPDTFTLHAWEGRPANRLGRSTNRTGASWGANVVRFQSPTDGTLATGNILSDANRVVNAHLPQGPIWVGAEETYHKEAGPAGALYEGYVHSTAEDSAALASIGATQSTARVEAADVGQLRHPLDNDPANGAYLPGEHYLLDELVRIHTGSGEFDYDEADYPVGAWRVSLPAGRAEWEAYPELGAGYDEAAERKFEIAAQPSHTHPPNPELCRPGGFPALVSSGFIPGGTGSGAINIPAGLSNSMLVVIAAWDKDSVPYACTVDGTEAMTAIPDSLVTNGAAESALQAFYLLNPPSGEGSEAIGIQCLDQVSGGTWKGWFLFSGVHQSAPFASVVTAIGSSQVSSVSISGSGVLLNAAFAYDTTGAAPVAGGQQIESWSEVFGPLQYGGGYGSSAPTWDFGASRDWVAIGLAVSASSSGDVPQPVGANGEAAVGTSNRATRCDHVHAHSDLSDHSTETHHHASSVEFTPTGTIAATDVQAAIAEVASEASGSAPSTADYLVGTAQAGLSAEIVVGTTPGGELGGTWASPTVDATHSGSSHAATQAAAEATADAALTAHEATPHGSPADDTHAWMPLTTVVAGVPELVWDADDSLIPTLTPI